MLPKSVRHYGTTSPLPDQTTLRAGPLSLLYENGDLRYVKLGDIEILRRIYVAVRDHNWDTIAATLTDVEMNIQEDAFAITYTALHQAAEVDFRWQGAITGDAQGTIVFQMIGEAHSSFRRNRIGFCVLHPMACAGLPANIEHVDGLVEAITFPQTIAPQLIEDGHPCPVSPFEEMRALSHQVLPDLWAKVHFAGDSFELEDQRNWTDASYKTYCTPLRLPFPVTVEAGTKIEQSITLTLEGDLPTLTTAPENVPITLTINPERVTPLPAIGSGMASHGQPLSEQELTRLQALQLHHLRVDLRLTDPDYLARLQQATAEAAALQVALEIALFVSDNAEVELANLAAQLPTIQPPVCHWLIFHQQEKTTAAERVDLARRQLTAYAPTAEFGAGSNAYFTEINAVRPATHNLDFVTYSINPQVHAFDNSSLVETLAAQAVTVESACNLANGRNVVVSPVTLLPRFNPNATGPEPDPPAGTLPSPVDVRQMSLFGAAWTLGSLKYLCGSDLQSVTYYETTGWRGVMETATGSPLPDKFQSQPNMVFPLYHILADIGEFAEGEFLPVQTSHALLVDGLALRSQDRLVVLIANLTAEQQRVQIGGINGVAHMRVLDETTFDLATLQPETYRHQVGVPLAANDGIIELLLLPYCSIRIDTN